MAQKGLCGPLCWEDTLWHRVPSSLTEEQHTTAVQSLNAAGDFMKKIQPVCGYFPEGTRFDA